jgi:hypothetical protein
MVWFLLALGAVCSFLIFWIVKNAEHQGEIKSELKQANESLKETNDDASKIINGIANDNWVDRLSDLSDDLPKT